MNTNISRRHFLTSLGASGAALAASGARFATPAGAAIPGERLTIHSVDCYPVKLWSGTPALSTFPSRRGAITSDFDPRRWLPSGPFGQLGGATVVVIHTDQGVTGYGLGCGGAAAATIIHGHLRDLLVGADARNIEMLWEQLYGSGLAYGRRGVFVMALSGIDNALWDIAGKAAGLPVWRLLGGVHKERVPAYYTGTLVERGLDMGFENFKLTGMLPMSEGREMMARTQSKLEEVRSQIGDERRLMIDCSMKWNDVEFTMEMHDRLAHLGLYFIEEPLSADDILGYAELVRRFEGPLVASGEHEYTHFGFEMLFHHKAIEVVQPDVSWCGGITSLRRISVIAEERGLPFIPHRGGSLFGLPLVLTSSNAPMAESFGTLDDAANDLMLAMTSPFERGHYLAPSGPGFGTEITEDLVKRHLAPA